jgi:hypothetical protein
MITKKNKLPFTDKKLPFIQKSPYFLRVTEALKQLKLVKVKKQAKRKNEI